MNRAIAAVDAARLFAYSIKKRGLIVADKANEEEIRNLVERYKEKLRQQFELAPVAMPREVLTKEYRDFRQELMPARVSLYEKLCKAFGKIIKFGVNPEKASKLQESIDIAHLDLKPSDTVAFSVLFPIVFALVGVILSYAIGSTFFALLIVFIALVLIPFLSKLPDFIANSWRMKASNQMVLCIFYIVTYMRHTSNLELAIEFASSHLAPPLSLDLKKIIWNVESGVFDSVKESLDAYLESWRKWNLEFVEAFHLIESSLYEPSDERRLELLDKSLDVILEETYEKMLHYAHNLKSPITTLHMLGVILPVLGLVILPLMVSFMGSVKWYHIAVLYNVLIPIAVYYLGTNILSTRPTGYGDSDISEINPALKKYKNVILKLGKSELAINPAVIAIIIGGILLLGAFLPLILHTFVPGFDFGVGIEVQGSPCGKQLCFNEYRTSIATEGPDVGKILGPYGLGASILSLLFPLAFGVGFGIYYRMRSQNVIKIREKSKKLEDEFSSALFQLGNRLGDGIPAEIAVGKVSEVMGETVSGNFFSLVSGNIRKLGFGLKDAIFDPKVGALTYFPSNVIESAMKVLVDSIKKGPAVASQAMLNVSRYIKEIHRVDERLKDLMADIIADMKSQISFLTPAIAGIVIGITSMITTIIGQLSNQVTKLSTPEVGGNISTIAGLFGDGIPTYYFQLVVGIYVVEIIAILTILANGIENGADKLNERYTLGKNLIRSTFIYVAIALIVMLLFNFIAAKIMASTLAVT